MSEKKVVGRNVVIAVGIIAIILLVGLAGAVMNYTSIINTKDSTIQSKDSQMQTLTSQKNQLQTWLDGNKTLLNQTQTWLNGNLTLIDTLNTQITNLQDQISDLNSQISSLNVQITSLQSQIDSLNQTYLDYVSTHSHSDSEYDTLQSAYNNYVATHHHTDSEYDALQSQIESLKAAQLHKINVAWSDHHPLIGSPYISISGTIFNSGTYSAYNVVLTVKIYSSAGTLLKSEELSFGTISGKSYTNFETTIDYSGDASYITTTLSYT
jgi:uncharacterized protein YoxC